MKKIISLTILLALVLAICGCQQNNDELEDMMFEEYLKGMEQAEENVFLQLYNSVPKKQKLYRNITWVEKDFTFTISDFSEDTKTKFSITLYLPNSTARQVLDDNNVYIGIYGLRNGYGPTDINAWDELCDSFDSFFYYAIINKSTLDDNVLKATGFSSYYTLSSVAVVISINGSIYSADYEL